MRNDGNFQIIEYVNITAVRTLTILSKFFLAGPTRDIFLFSYSKMIQKTLFSLLLFPSESSITAFF